MKDHKKFGTQIIVPNRCGADSTLHLGWELESTRVDCPLNIPGNTFGRGMRTTGVALEQAIVDVPLVGEAHAGGPVASPVW